MYGLIYMHTCNISHKSYIGQTTKTMEKRWSEHLNNTKKNTKLSKAINKYGKYCWTHCVLSYANNKSDLDDLEKFFIEKYNTIKNGYNTRKGGHYAYITPEGRKKMSDKRKGCVGHPHTEESKLKIKLANTGKRFTEEHKKSLSLAKKGKPLTEKQLKARKSMIGKNNPNYGKVTTKSAIKKMRDKMGKKLICVETGMIFSCSAEAANYIGVKRCGIQKCLVKGGKSHGFTWKYI